MVLARCVAHTIWLVQQTGTSEYQESVLLILQGEEVMTSYSFALVTATTTTTPFLHGSMEILLVVEMTILLVVESL